MTTAAQEASVTERVWSNLESAMETDPGVLRVLFATDGSPYSQAAAHLLGLLPLPVGSHLRVLTVQRAEGWDRPHWMTTALEEWAHRTSDTAAAALTREGVVVDTAVRAGEEAREVLAAAEELDAGLIVLGSKGLTGLEAFLIGSIARNVAKHARRPVLVAREPRHHLKRVVLAVDESQHARDAARFLAALPLPAPTEITVLHVLRPENPALGLMAIDNTRLIEALQVADRERRERASSLVEEARAWVAASGHRAEAVVREGDPAAEVLRLATEYEADLIVAGARGVSLIEGLLVGSVADRVLKSAACSVLLAH